MNRQRRADLECLTASELAVDADWWGIYNESFPAIEREPPEVILKSLRDSVGMAFRARRNNVTSGIATTHLLLNPAAVFLVYLAVDATQRGGGGGSALLEFAWTESSMRLRAKGAEPTGMIWEVEEYAGECDRRIQFFERQGGKLLTRPYCQPPVNGPGAVPMRLMFRPARGAPPIDNAAVEALVRAIYFDKYGAVNGIPAPLLGSLLSKA